jgi:hypothetical protein
VIKNVLCTEEMTCNNNNNNNNNKGGGKTKDLQCGKKNECRQYGLLCREVGKEVTWDLVDSHKRT